jgi:hypothetical protein
VIRKEDIPVAAIMHKINNVWYATNYELISGTTFADYPPDLVEEDFNFINKTLKRLGMKEVPKSKKIRFFKSKEAIQEAFSEAIDKGDVKSLRRFIYNLGASLRSKNTTRSSEIENRLIALKDPGLLIYYAKVVLRSRWPQAEATIFGGNND